MGNSSGKSEALLLLPCSNRLLVNYIDFLYEFHYNEERKDSQYNIHYYEKMYNNILFVKMCTNRSREGI